MQTTGGVGSFVFALLLTNVYGYSSSGSAVVGKSGVALLPLYLSGPAYQSASRSQAFQQQASSASSLCGQSIASLSLSFSWLQMNTTELPDLASMTIGGVSLVGQTLGGPLSFSGASLATLSLPAFSMSVGSTYGSFSRCRYCIHSYFSLIFGSGVFCVFSVSSEHDGHRDSSGLFDAHAFLGVNCPDCGERSSLCACSSHCGRRSTSLVRCS